MKYLLPVLAAALSLTFAVPAHAVKLHYEITNVSGGWCEFKAESDKSNGEKATGHIHAGGTQTGDWELGPSDQNIWFWWDTLYGGAHLKLEIDGTPMIDADCHNGRIGEVRPTNTIVSASTLKTTGSPHVQNGPNFQVNFVRW